MEEKEKLGLPNGDMVYHKIDSNQNTLMELIATQKFLNIEFFEYIRTKYPELYSLDMELEFINYGDTQLVYVLKTKGKMYAILMGQPAAQYGIVKSEYDNLNYLALNNPKEIVCPIGYFTNDQRELYIAPYLYQARCIASQESGWGLYIPEPNYRFETFNKKERLIVNSSIIALLIKLFDDKKSLGLATCKIGGGDFILEKEWSNEGTTFENTLNRMKLIAARELIEIDLQEYIYLIREEFSKRTYYNKVSERDTRIIINHKSRIPMTEEEIEKGIEIGFQLRKNRQL